MPDNIIEEPTEAPAEPEAPAPEEKPGIKDGSREPWYEVLKYYRPPNDIRLYHPGAILDLGHLSREDLRRAMNDKYIQTANGPPGEIAASQLDKPPCVRC